MNQKSPLIVAQITDTHLFATDEQQMLGLTTYDSFQAIVTHLRQLQPKPDILLLTGDLSQDETNESYQRVKEIISPLEIPTYWIPGNHDDLTLMQQVLNQSPIFVDKSFTVGEWHFLLLSSWVPGQVYGKLSGASLEWLEQQLQLIGDKPTLISLHHPPCAIASDWMDRIKLQNPEEFFAIIDRYPQVKLVLFGHIHQAFEARRYGVRYLGSPSTCVQFKPESVEFALDSIQPGFRLLTLNSDGTFETKIERVYN
ncbi:MAG TPA: 3',5'-cyclic-AMP phosphodiesterase [Cyanobacteria bacterium UBA11049]|nr:3',5'-cyclic-AMP phosphodiesterase [Cyanobacteria bacterium UBA11049]